MDILDIFIQAVGVVAMFFSVFSYQMNRHKQIMFMQIVATGLFGLLYFMLGAITGMAACAIGVVRGFVFYHKDKKWARWNGFIVLFIIAFIISGILTWQGPLSVLMIVAFVLSTFSFSFTKPMLVRATILISSPMMLVFDILTGSIGGIINEILVEVSSVVGLLRYDIKWKKKA